MRTVRPVLPVAPYVGGKRNLARRLVALIDGRRHQTYVEVFVGMGGVFFRRTRLPAAEVINDRNRDVATLFRVLQRHHAAFLDMLRFQLTSRAEFARLVATDAGTLTDLERAARFLYLQRTAFGGKVSGRNFGVSVGLRGRFDVTRLGPMLQDVHERLAGVVIECLPWAELLDRYDRPTTLFYLDPPYWGSEADYGPDLFARDDFSHLAERLARLRGRFVLSINDRRETRALFGCFKVQPVETTYTISAGAAAKRAAELIVTGPRRRRSWDGIARWQEACRSRGDELED